VSFVMCGGVWMQKCCPSAVFLTTHKTFFFFLIFKQYKKIHSKRGK